MNQSRIGLYPEIEPYRAGYLDVSDGHRIYYEEVGNPNGKPALFIHGGPGGATNPTHRRFFDPDAFRIILFDQRGCGRSRPQASLRANTTWHLVSDIEFLRRNLNIEQWLLFGGSWGSTLSLAYAQRHPDAVSEMVLRGIFLLRRSELRWFYQSGASHIFPDAWEEFFDHIPAVERDDMIAAYYKRLTSNDPAVCLAAARIWTRWEKQTAYLLPNQEELDKVANDAYSLAFARLECHYFINGGFFETEDSILGGVPIIRNKPTIILQGRYDMVCPMMTAWELHRSWPEADFRIIADAGHSANEPGTARELVKATNTFRGT